MNKYYLLMRREGEKPSVVVLPGGSTQMAYELPRLFGREFEWGDSASLTVGTGLSILTDLFHENPTAEDLETGRSRAGFHRQDVAWRFLIRLDSRERHVLDGDDILAFCNAREEPCAGCTGSGEADFCAKCGLTKNDCGKRSLCDEAHEFEAAACPWCYGLRIQRKRAMSEVAR